MIIFTYDKIKKYNKANNSSDTLTDSLNNWYRIMAEGDFSNISQLKKIFGTVDYVGNDRYVFDILGNHYRLIAMIHFKVRTVYILFIGTHKEYDKIDAKNVQHND